MKLFIRRNISAENTAFDVFNEQGYEKYSVILNQKKELAGFQIVSVDGCVMCKVRKMQIGNMSTYSIKDNNRRARLVCVPAPADIKCRIYGVNWHISGDTFSKNFGIIDVDNSVVATHKKIISDFELNVFDKANELLSIAICICINLINTVDNCATQAV